MTPTVSVVIPAYNNERFIAATVDSVLAQTYDDYELLIADHSSTDGTWRILQRYADHPKVRLLTTPAGGGAIANWTAVTDQAQGEYLKLLCGDDLIYPTCLERQVAAMQQHNAVLVTSKRDIIDAAGDFVVRGRGLQGARKVTPGVQAIRAAVLAGTNIFGEPGTVLVRRSALEHVGGWDGRDPFVIDQQTFCNVLTTGTFAPVDETLAAFRLSQEQWSVRLTKLQAQQVLAFHHRFNHEHPGVLSSRDLLIGDSRARLTALIRRIAYVWMRRQHASAHATSEVTR